MTLEIPGVELHILFRDYCTLTPIAVYGQNTINHKQRWRRQASIESGRPILDQLAIGKGKQLFLTEVIASEEFLIIHHSSSTFSDMRCGPGMATFRGAIDIFSYKNHHA
jgi:hypothetical protein